MAKKLTKKQIKKYVEAEGNHCPYCGSKDVEATGNKDFDGDWATAEIECKKCGKYWKDVYALCDIQES